MPTLESARARVSTCYFPQASHDLGKRVEPELRAFLRDNLLVLNRAAVPDARRRRSRRYPSSFNVSITSSVCPFTFTLANTLRTTPLLSMTNVVRSIPRTRARIATSFCKRRKRA